MGVVEWYIVYSCVRLKIVYGCGEWYIVYGIILGITLVSSVSKSLYFLTVTLVNYMLFPQKYEGISIMFVCALYITCCLTFEKYGDINTV
jgi:hypothetical protein